MGNKTRTADLVAALRTISQAQELLADYDLDTSNETIACHQALDALDRVTQHPAGNSTGRNQHSTGTFDNIQSSSPVEAPTGTSSAAALRRLRKERPDLHARVLAEELTPHRAMVEAGFRKPTITIPREVDAAARALRRGAINNLQI